MQLSELKGRRIAILGFGREGRAAEALISRRFPEQPLVVFTGEEKPPPKTSQTRYQPGLPDADSLKKDFDIAIRSPGISPYLPVFADPRVQRVRITTGTEIWFAEHPAAFTVAVTGTKGKSTTAALAAHLLRAYDHQVALGGNIGEALLNMMSVQADIWVMELSSFQIHGLSARPSIAVILNLSPEHLDWHGDEERYYKDKLSIAKNMESAPVILNSADDNLCTRMPEVSHPVYFNTVDTIHAKDGAVHDGNRRLFDLDGFQLPGAHNRANLCAALTIVKTVGLDPALADAAAKVFQPLAHHLQAVGCYGGIEFVNDSISTTPRSLISALDCYPDRFITALVGGYDRGLNWGEFDAYAKARPVQTVIAFGAAGGRIARSLTHAPQVERVATMAEAVALAKAVTPSGGLVLLSPGAPSFDAFRNYEERGDAFTRLAATE